MRDRHTGAVVLRDSYYIHDPYRGALEYQKAITILENMYDIKRRGSFTVALRKKELYPVTGTSAAEEPAGETRP